MNTNPVKRQALRVLVVDDDADTANSSVLVLQHLGYQASAAYAAEQALDRALLLQPHAVLLDIAMPGRDGYHLARALRELPGLHDVLLICVSGYGGEPHRQQALEAGCNYHLIKPAEWQEVASLIDRWACVRGRPMHKDYA